ncbi:MAG: peptidase, partial [Dactylosporangium sp.]|nr:peptidase [Dactylosporangium sp.]
MPSPVRRTAAVLAGVLALTAVGVSPAAAAPPGPDPVPSRQPGDQGRAARVTLITGDVVELAPAGDGRYAATVRPAAGRERITFHTLEVDGGLRVLPSDAVPLLAAGKLDADLFDVEELIADGYGDTKSTSLPLIVKYQQLGDTGVRMLAGNSRPLTSIGGAALAADKSTLAGFWRAQTAQVKQAAQTRQATQVATFGGGIDRIWLDGRVRPALDRSTAQIGAPAAWQAGIDGHGVKVAVLDTGVDATHPDLAGRIKQAQNFTSSADTVDRFGHGTHVAATVGGTGAASNGSRRGVAPGADLLIGKVLGDDGSGYESWIIAGMEWAAAEGATVVNMSLGGEASDG